jgi:hypothetical protein
MHAAKTVTVHRAGDIQVSAPVVPCTITIGACIEDVLGRAATLAEAQLVYDSEAVLLADALVNHLPQATLDRVLLRLMERKVNATFYKGPLS